MATASIKTWTANRLPAARVNSARTIIARRRSLWPGLQVVVADFKDGKAAIK
jgi:hypothetical protein